ncbi:hypothetical protein H632_c1055p1, partial [Helicosporidium sp. ATCC 50920]
QVDIENQYYTSKGLLESGESFEDALSGFEAVLEMESDDKERWCFRAMKQIVKIHARQGNYSSMLSSYERMLAALSSASIGRSAAEKKLSSLLDALASLPDASARRALYIRTLRALSDPARNERLWFKTGLRAATLEAESGRPATALKLLKTLARVCRTPEGQDDPRRGSHLLDVYALTISVLRQLRRTHAVPALAARALAIRSAVPHPRIVGIVRESSGHAALASGAYEAAATDFFEAFKSYDEAGSSARLACLHYVALSTLLMGSDVDPFDSQEARPYRAEPGLQATARLVAAFRAADVAGLSAALDDLRAALPASEAFWEHVPELELCVRAKKVLGLARAYSCLRMDALAAQLRVGEDEAERLLRRFVAEERVAGELDAVERVFWVARERGEGAGRPAKVTKALEDWAEKLAALSVSVASRAGGGGGSAAS